MKSKIKSSWALGLAAAGLLAGAEVSNAALTITITEVGSAVVATSAGSILTAGMNVLGLSNGSTTGQLNPGQALVAVGTGGYDLYGRGASFSWPGPAFGPGLSRFSTTDIGSFVGVYRNSSTAFVVVPVGYVSGAPLPMSTSTFGSASFVSLGLVPGTYKATWGDALTGDSFTVQVGASAIPEPSAMFSCGLLLGSVFLLRDRRRQRG